MEQRRSGFKKQSATRRVISTFKQLMVQGSLVPGSRLPAERDLAKALRVSRSSLRQALKVMEIMGVISQQVGHGTYLKTGASSILSEPMEFLILMDGISSHEVLEARMIVEPELAARAASRSTQEDLNKLRRAVRSMEESGRDHIRLTEQDLLFHRAIFDAAGNRLCSLMFSVLHKSVHRVIKLTSRMVDLQHTVKFHKRIYAAIARKDPEGARVRMLEHLEDVKGLLTRVNEDQARSQLQDRISVLTEDLAREVEPALKVHNG